MTSTTPFLKSKTALVTGSAAGIGHAIADALASAGCDVVLHGIEPPEALQPVQARLERTHGVRVGYMRVDLCDALAIASMMAEIERVHGPIDILVNNAVTRHFAPIESFPVEAWDKALAVNVSAAFHTIRLALPAMRARGWGRIFNLTSVYGVRAVANRVDYVTSKAAIQGLTRAVALETLSQGITCNAICPGSVLTPSIDARVQALMEAEGLDRDDAVKRFLDGKQPMQRFVDAGHIAQLLVFLCGAAGSDITGAMLPIEGGWLAG